MDFFAKLSDKEKKGLIISLLILLLAFFDSLIFSPIERCFQRLNQAISTSEKQLIHSVRNMGQKDTIFAEYQKYEPYFKKAASDEEEVAQIFAEIESIAREAKVYLVNVKPMSPVQVDFYKEYTVDIDVEGTPESVTAFLYKLNVSSQLLRAVRVRLEPKDKTSNAIKASILVTRDLI